jgi:pimeloyl-ACP methyl ester carboxylesterase
VYLTHSQSGPFGWKLADTFPELIKAVVAVEPNGPPFYDVVFPGGDPWYEFKPGTARPQGLTREALQFDPPPGPEGFAPVRAAASGNPDLVQGWLQPEPARKLPRLAQVPVMILTGQASYRATYDQCTSAFLTQAGVANTHIRLEDAGVFGNSHMMMLELNNADSAKVIINWLEKTVACPPSAPC